MPSKQAYLLLLAIFANPSVWAQQTPQAPIDSGNTAATINCHNQPSVSVTADEEQAVPLQVVATLSCNEPVWILSDPQGYTVRVRTASGKIGYVTRFEVTIDSSKPEGAGRKAGETDAHSPDAQAQGRVAGQAPFESHSDTPGSSKPRIYVSDSESWIASGGFSNPSSVAAGNLYGGYNPDPTIPNATGTKLFLAPFEAIADNPAAMVSLLNQQMTGGQFPTALEATIVTAVNAVTVSNPPTATERTNRARMAVYLMASSYDYQVQR